MDGGLNTYGYALQNPINFIDPDGLQVAVLSGPVAPPAVVTGGQTNGVSKAPLNLNQLAKELRGFTGTPTGLDILFTVNNVAQTIINGAIENICSSDSDNKPKCKLKIERPSSKYPWIPKGKVQCTYECRTNFGITLITRLFDGEKCPDPETFENDIVGGDQGF